jgi:SAM-dependent methyltransferase
MRAIMGIAPYIAEAIVREHKHRPITGDVLLLGRQTFSMTPDDAVGMLRSNGIEPAKAAMDEISIDQSTRHGANRGYISDVAFFALLGSKSVRALDVTDYEGAEIIHDLNTPAPDDLSETADFILDGSTLDNLFNPAIALQSITRMLRPGGRFLALNMASAHASPYTILTPHWFADYLAINQFEDAKVYVTVHGYRGGSLNAFAVKYGDPAGRAFQAQQTAGIVVFGEKGPATTWDVLPCQRSYASAEQIARYFDSEKRFAANSRPDLIVSKGPHLGYSLFGSFVEHFRAATSAQHYELVGADGHRKISPPSFIMRHSASLRRIFDV